MAGRTGSRPRGTRARSCVAKRSQRTWASLSMAAMSSAGLDLGRVMSSTCPPGSIEVLPPHGSGPAATAAAFCAVTTIEGSARQKTSHSTSAPIRTCSEGLNAAAASRETSARVVVDIAVRASGGVAFEPEDHLDVHGGEPQCRWPRRSVAGHRGRLAASWWRRHPFMKVVPPRRRSCVRTPHGPNGDRQFTHVDDRSTSR